MSFLYEYKGPQLLSASRHVKHPHLQLQSTLQKLLRCAKCIEQPPILWWRCAGCPEVTFPLLIYRMTDLSTHFHAQQNCAQDKCMLKRQRIQAQAPTTPTNCEHFKGEHSCKQVSHIHLQWILYLYLEFALQCWFSMVLCTAHPQNCLEYLHCSIYIASSASSGRTCTGEW